MNQVCLVGRLASDPYKFEGEKYNRAVATVAINEGKDKATFVRVYSKGVLADFVTTLKKGDIVSFEGHLVVQEAKDTKYSLQVYADRLSFCSRKKVLGNTVEEEKTEE